MPSIDTSSTSTSIAASSTSASVASSRSTTVASVGSSMTGSLCNCKYLTLRVRFVARYRHSVSESRPRGRPLGTSARELELVALRFFTQYGFDDTTVEQIASGAGVSRRTFFRYYDSKAAVLWHEFDREVEALRLAFEAFPSDRPMMSAIRDVVVGVNRYRAEDVPELRMRINLIGAVPALQASASPHYDAWERAVSEFAARRLDTAPTALVPLAVGRATLATCRASFDHWVRRADADLTVYLDRALTALAAGFAR